MLDATGADANSAADATAVSSTIAVKLAKGDSLVLDTDGDHVADAGEKVFALITGGKAILYATSKDANPGFLESEITGLAVSDGFKAPITGTLTGSIATMLDKTGAFVPGKLANASIAGLTITERVTGSILAGRPHQEHRHRKICRDDRTRHRGECETSNKASHWLHQCFRFHRSAETPATQRRFVSGQQGEVRGYCGRRLGEIHRPQKMFEGFLHAPCSMNLPSLRSLTSLYTMDRPFARIANVTGVVLIAFVTLG